jgi:hypothetical protein
VAVALVGVGALTSCAGDAAEVTASLESAPRPAAEGQAPIDEGLGGELSPEPSAPALPTPDDLPDAEQLADCVELTSAYAEVQVLAFTGDPEGRLDAQFELLEAAAPAEVADALATVRSVIEGLGGDAGVLDATQALLSEEYTTANEAIIDWLTTSCGG